MLAHALCSLLWSEKRTSRRLNDSGLRRMIQGYFLMPDGGKLRTRHNPAVGIMAKFVKCNRVEVPGGLARLSTLEADGTLTVLRS
jgi:hypothetical protein